MVLWLEKGSFPGAVFVCAHWPFLVAGHSSPSVRCVRLKENSQNLGCDVPGPRSLGGLPSYHLLESYLF